MVRLVECSPHWFARQRALQQKTNYMRNSLQTTTFLYNVLLLYEL